MGKILKLLNVKTPEIEFDYKKSLINIMKSPLNPHEGVSIDEIRQSVKVLNILEDLKENTLKLEDADFNYMKSKVDSYKWAIADKIILDFVDAVDKASKEEVLKN